MLEWGGAAAQKVAETAISVAKRMSHFEEASVDDFEWIATMWANVTPAKDSTRCIHIRAIYGPQCSISTWERNSQAALTPAEFLFRRPALSDGRDA